MGSCLSTDGAKGSAGYVVLFLGLDGSGATTVLYQLVHGRHLQTIPTLGNNHETVNLHGLKLDCWDIGGLEKMRHLWIKYSQEADGIIFVVDASDKSRLKMASKELKSIYNLDDSDQKHSEKHQKSKHDPKNDKETDSHAAEKDKKGVKPAKSEWHVPLPELPLLILANKQDLPDAASPEEIAEALDVASLPSKYRKITPCSALDHDNLVDAVKWMTDCFKERSSSRRK